MSQENPDGPVLLSFDGSDDAANGIAAAGRLLRPRPAVVVTVLEPIELWAPYDPATILDAGIAKLASKPLGLDEIADDIAQEHRQRDGVARRSVNRSGGGGQTARNDGPGLWIGELESARA
jgi:hypothetical protein